MAGLAEGHSRGFRVWFEEPSQQRPHPTNPTHTRSHPAPALPLLCTHTAFNGLGAHFTLIPGAGCVCAWRGWIKGGGWVVGWEGVGWVWTLACGAQRVPLRTNRRPLTVGLTRSTVHPQGQGSVDGAVMT
jgi:hypothetical protein